jgi:glycosyltransferase involved in cell wall biosynthesis
VHEFAANSRHVAGRIARYYNRTAAVLYPPVDVAFFTPGDGPPANYFLVVSALVPYKRLEVAIRAAARLRTPLKIVGTGPDLARLRAIAGPDVEFIGRVDDDTLRNLYRRARALVLPAEEDFGIAPVEALACGRPVVALGRGGATETVEPGLTGALVAEPDAELFADAMDDVGRKSFDTATLADRARRFSVDRFESGFRELVGAALVAHAC